MCVYNNIWSDLGTWDAFLENTECSRNEKVIFGSEVSNTDVINYLEIPIVINGVNNAIVVAHDNGILIIDREKVEDLKAILENEIEKE